MLDKTAIVRWMRVSSPIGGEGGIIKLFGWRKEDAGAREGTADDRRQPYCVAPMSRVRSSDSKWNDGDGPLVEHFRGHS